MDSPSSRRIAELAARSPFVHALGEAPTFEPFVGDVVKRLLCSPFVPSVVSADYEKYTTAPTTGRMTPFINGRSWGGVQPAHDQVEAFDAMQAAVEALKSGCTLFLAAWMFQPSVALTKTGAGGTNALGNKTWGELLQRKARDGVTIRIIVNDFDPIAAGLRDLLYKRFLPELDQLIDGLPAGSRDRLKYIVSRHPAIHRTTIEKTVLGKVFKVPLSAHVGTHHEKFMVLKTDAATTAFCGGLDIAYKRTPADWQAPGYRWLWHDVHCKLEGLIVRDLEREFVMRWNREKSLALTPPRPGWRALEKLALSRVKAADQAAALNPQTMQVQRTVSVAGVPIHTNRRDDIWQGYLRLIGCATKFLYLENQYFRKPRMADAIVKQARAHPALVVIVVVPSETDDDPDIVTLHGNAMQHEFFRRLVGGMPAARLRVYSMVQRIIHSKFMMADDRDLTLGSANANPRGFSLDTELNLMLREHEAVAAFRHRLWAHNLGLAPATVAGWGVASFLANWDAVARANDAKRGHPSTMVGEAIIPFDPLKNPGQRHPQIHDVETEADPIASAGRAMAP